MNKEELIKTLSNNLSNLVNDFKDRVSTIHTMSDIDEMDTIDPEDLSHQAEAQEFEYMLKGQISEVERQLLILKEIPRDAMNVVSYGSVVETDRHNFYIAFATAPFSFNNSEILGISMNSPIYSVMINKKAGDEFEFCGVHYKILKIY